MISNRRPSTESLWLLSTNLRSLRKARGYTQIELARRTGLTNSYISKIERELKNPSLANLDALARGLEASLPDLFAPVQNEDGP